MGTYLKLIVKTKYAKKVNDNLENLGFPTESFNGVKYGAFRTLENLKEDARFMNEDEEGLKQQPNWKRPISYKDLEQFFWNERNTFTRKISCLGEIEENEVKLVFNYAYNNLELFDWDKSKYSNKSDLLSYGIKL